MRDKPHRTKTLQPDMTPKHTHPSKIPGSSPNSASPRKPQQQRHLPSLDTRLQKALTCKAAAVPNTAVKPQHSHLMELSSRQKPAASPGNNQGKRTHLQLQVAVKSRRPQRQSVPADGDTVQSFQPEMGTSLGVSPRAKPALATKVFHQGKWEEETQSQPVGHAGTGAGRKEGQRLISGKFVNTSGKRKRNDVFDLPALCGRSHWVPQRELSPCSHSSAPWGAKERVFPPRRGVGQPRSVGAEQTPQEQRALDGSQQSTGWLWKPGIPGQQSHQGCATTPWSLLDPWQDSHLHMATAATLCCTLRSASEEQWVAQPQSRI